MPMLIDIKAFLVTARSGSFSAAARELRLAPSVITKRVGRLEHAVGCPLFIRSTRRLTLTAEAERLRPRLQVLVAELEEAIAGVKTPQRALSGPLRIKSPTTVGTLFVGEMVARFQAAHPGVTTDLVLLDRAINPLEEAFDVALGAIPQSWPGVLETPLCAYPRVLVAAPSYLERAGMPNEPADLVRHDCLGFVPAGLSWPFESARGPVQVGVHARFMVNDSRILIAAAEEGLGFTVVPEFLARPGIEAGRLVPALPEFPIATFWFKAMVPRNKAQRPEIAALLEHLQEGFSPPPWER